MASHSDEGNRGTDDSSEEESLATLKRKANENEGFENERQRMEEDSDDEGLLPGICVKVEVLDDPDSETADFNDESVSRGRPKRKSRNQRPATDPDYVADWRPPKRKKNTSCPDCGKVFENATEMKKHSIEHQVQTRHKCDECGRCFSKAFGLKTHKRMHGEKNQHCPLCEASFTLAINLNKEPPDARQMALLVEFLDSNPELAKGDRRNVSRGAEKWTSVAETLNGGGAAKRDWKGWSKYWLKKKHDLKKAHVQNEFGELTDIDKKMASLMQGEINEEPSQSTEMESSDTEPEDSPKDESTPRNVAQCYKCKKEYPAEETGESHAKTSCETAKEQTLADESKENASQTETESERKHLKSDVTYARSGPTNRPSRNQLKKLVRLLQRHPELAKGVARTAPGRFEAKKKWASWAKRLNRLGGARKDGNGWSKFWIEKKCYLKRVCAKRETWKLSPLYVKMVALLDNGSEILSRLGSNLTREDNQSSQETGDDESVSGVASSDGENNDSLPADSTPKGKRPNHSQMATLVEFLESNPHIVRCAGMNAQARLDTRRKWELLAGRLNALGDRTQRDGRGWAKYWIERKCYIRKTLAQQEAAKLSVLEKRLAPLLGYHISPTQQPNTSDEEDEGNKTIAKETSETTDTEVRKLDTGENQTLLENFLSADTPRESSSNPPEEEKIAVNSIRPSRSQLEALVEFLEKYPDIATGNAKFMVARARAKRKWARTTARLNALGLATKDSPGWVKYWVEKKCFIKKMCHMKWLSRLTDLEIRLAQALGYAIEEVEDKEQGKHFVLVEKSKDSTEPVKGDFTLSRLSTSDEEYTSSDREKDGDSLLTVVVERDNQPLKIEPLEAESNRDPLGLHAVLIKEERLCSQRNRTPCEGVPAKHSEAEGKSGVLNESKTTLEPSLFSQGLTKMEETQARLSAGQVEALVEFMRSAAARGGGAMDRRRVWTDMAGKLNALGGVRKGCRGWMAFWEKKMTQLRAVCAQNSVPPSNQLDRKLLALMRGETIENAPETEDLVHGYKSEMQSIISRHGEATSHRPSAEQLGRLIHFLKRNPGIAKAQLRTAQGRMESKKKWAALAKRLNALEGARKDGHGWSKYWAERKCVLRKVSAKHGPGKLTPMDRRMLALVDDDFTSEAEDQEVQDDSDEMSDRDREAVAQTSSDEIASRASCDEGLTQTSKGRDSRRPNLTQMMKLVEFLERNPAMVRQRARYLRARAEIKAKWGALATCLNALGTVEKDAHGWAKFWTEKKCYLKRVCAQRDTAKLSAMELRLIALMEGDPAPSAPQMAPPFHPSLHGTSDVETQDDEPTLSQANAQSASHTDLTHSVFTDHDQALLENFFSSETPKSEDPPIKQPTVPPTGVENAASSDESVDGEPPRTAPVPVRAGNSSRPSLRQIEALLMFLERNPDIASGRLRGAQNVEGKWRRLAGRLNAMGEARKDMRGWIKYWTEKKCYIKKVCKMQWWSRLSDLDVRLAALIGFTIEAIEDSEQGSIMTVKEERKTSTNPAASKEVNDLEDDSSSNEGEVEDSFCGEHKPKVSVVREVNSNRPTNVQIEMLVKFLERNPAIANCRLRGAQYASFNVEGKWNRLTEKINAAGEACRDRRGWMKYWAEKKSYVKKMCKMRWWSRLSEPDVRLAAVIGYTVEVAEDGEQGRHLTLRETPADLLKPAVRDSASEESDDSFYQDTTENPPSPAESDALTARGHPDAPPDGVEYTNSHRPSLRQLEGLTRFLEGHPDLANGTRGITGGIRRSLDVEGKWSRLAGRINPLGEACKDGRGWSKCWVEKKCHIKKMCAMKWWSRLSDVDLRLAAVIGYTVEPANDPAQGNFYTIKDTTLDGSGQHQNLPPPGNNPVTAKGDGGSSGDRKSLERVNETGIQESSDEDAPESKSVLTEDVNSIRPSPEQVAALVEFMERNPGFAGGEYRGMLRRVRRLQGKWDRLSNRLNNLGDARKHRRGWMKYWIEKKCHIKKICEARDLSKLSHLDLRLASVIGYAADAATETMQRTVQPITVKCDDFAPDTVDMYPDEDNGLDGSEGAETALTDDSKDPLNVDLEEVY